MKPAAIPCARPRLRPVIPLGCKQTMKAPRTVASPERVVRKRARGREEVVERSWVEEEERRDDGGGCARRDMVSVYKEGWMERKAE